MDTTVNVLSLFSGIGGLDLGLRMALPRARTVCFVEREAACVEIMASRMSEGLLDSAPIWTDITTFDGRPWRGVVDCVIGGFPCQDISNAGKRAGITGERSGLWSHYARILAEVEPAIVFIENVSALIGRGLETVLRDLAALGFDAEWGCFRASDVGAPHKRERIFILALSPSRIAERWGRGRAREMGDPDHKGLEGRRGPKQRRADSTPPWPPGPKSDGWADYLSRWPGLEPAIRRGPDGIAGWVDRIDRLRALGNAVVPAQAELAFRVLRERLSQSPPGAPARSTDAPRDETP